MRQIVSADLSATRSIRSSIYDDDVSSTASPDQQITKGFKIMGCSILLYDSSISSYKPDHAL